MSLTDRAAAARPPTSGRIGKGGPAAGRDDLRIFLVAGEHSGDALGGKLMAALSAQCKGRIHYLGVGGEDMERAGLASQFPLADVAVMGLLSILPRLPRIISRVHRTVDAAVAAEPDAVVIIDSPEFTHPIAKRIRKRAPLIPIIDYVSPSVWAWRPGRARKMRPYVDHVLALLPFEPEAHERLGGPPCTYVGHPLIERLDWLHDLDPNPLIDRLGLDPGRLVLVVLPGSRTSEVSHLMQPFGEALELLHARRIRPQVIIPVVPHVRELVERLMQSWTVKPHLVEGEEDKFRAFKLAHAALAASGTVTLQLALAGTPMVVAYRVDAFSARLRPLLNVPSVVLANLVLGENAFPEYLQDDCTPQALADALEQLLRETPERHAQLAALARIPQKMVLEGGTPSDFAAEIVLDYAAHGRRPAV
jgi:lipid-A-disaccharide synthase